MQRWQKIILSMVGVPVLIGFCYVEWVYHQRRRLRRMAQHVIQGLNETDITYWVDYGTLLCMHREVDIILLDNDVDICIPSVSKEQWQMFGAQMTSMGYELQSHILPAISRVFEPGGLFTDVYDVTLSEDGTVYYGPTGPNSDIPAHLIGVPITVPWTVDRRTTPVRVPEDIEGVLRWRYGDDYMTPRPGYKGRDS